MVDAVVVKFLVAMLAMHEDSHANRFGCRTLIAVGKAAARDRVGSRVRVGCSIVNGI